MPSTSVPQTGTMSKLVHEHASIFSNEDSYLMFVQILRHIQQRAVLPFVKQYVLAALISATRR